MNIRFFFLFAHVASIRHLPPLSLLPLQLERMHSSWQGSFMGRKRKKVWWVAPLYLFWTVWKESNSGAFNNKELSDQRIRFAFLCNHWARSKLFIVLGFFLIVEFVDWIWAHWVVLFFVSPSFFFGGAINAFCIFPVYFGGTFLAFLFTYEKNDFVALCHGLINPL